MMLDNDSVSSDTAFSVEVTLVSAVIRHGINYEATEATQHTLYV